MYISSFFIKNSSREFDEPWYTYVLLFLFAPLAVLALPFIFFDDLKEDKKHKKLAAEREALEKKEKEKKASANAAFQSASNSTADYAAVGNKLHQMARDKKYNDFLKCLDKIELPGGAELIVEECDEDTSDIGDESRLLVQLPNGATDENIFNHLIVQKSAMGAWQAYLLQTLWHVLPLFWHGNYHARDYVFSKEDASRVSPFKEEDKPAIVNQISKFDVTPEVRGTEGKYFVSSCYWSDFGGLIRENVELTFDGNKVTNIFQFDSKKLHEYNCGIYF